MKVDTEERDRKDAERSKPASESGKASYIVEIKNGSIR